MRYRLVPILASLILSSGCVATIGEPEGVDDPATDLLAFPGRQGPVYEGVFLVEGIPRLLEYELIDGHAIFEGDIHLPLEESEELGNGEALLRSQLAAASDRRRWPGGVVYYQIDPSLPDPERVARAVEHWEAHTPIRFVQRAEPGHVRIVPGAGCSADIGYDRGGSYVRLSSRCGVSEIIHELGHTMGLWHEQSRSDRDSHVTVHWDNIAPEHHRQFRTYRELRREGSDIGPYDHGSVMHYSSHTFSANGQPTITRRDGSLIRRGSGLSSNDARGVREFYSSATTPTETCRPYVDICDSVFEDDIVWVHSQNIARGCTSSHYCPKRHVTRGQMATFLIRALRLPPGPNAFDDDNGHAHEHSIDAIAAAGISGGCGTRRFCPNDPVSRAQMASFLRRAFSLPSSTRNAFDDDEGSVHEPAIDAVAAAGIVRGCGTRTYCPDRAVTREQMAAFLHRAMTR